MGWESRHKARIARARIADPGRVSRPACKPGFVPASRRVTVIYLAPRLPAGSSGLPGDRNGPGRSCPLLGLAPGGVCRASRSPGCWCALTLRAEAPHHFTLTGGQWAVDSGQWTVKKPDRSLGFHCPLSTIHCPLSQAVSFCCTVPPVGGPCRGTEPLPGVGVTHHRALWSPDFPPGSSGQWIVNGVQ